MCLSITFNSPSPEIFQFGELKYLIAFRWMKVEDGKLYPRYKADEPYEFHLHELGLAARKARNVQDVYCFFRNGAPIVFKTTLGYHSYYGSSPGGTFTNNFLSVSPNGSFCFLTIVPLNTIQAFGDNNTVVSSAFILPSLDLLKTRYVSGNQLLIPFDAYTEIYQELEKEATT